MKASSKKKIVWLVSYPKSGNTWFRIFLENIFSDSDEPKGINELNRTTIASSRLLIDQVLGVSSSNFTDTEIDELRPKVYLNLAQNSNDLVFIKVHDAWRELTSGSSMFPEEITKGVIYFIRNPLDIAVSFSYHSSKNINTVIQDMCNKNFTFCNNPKRSFHQVKQELMDWSGHVKSWIDSSKLPVMVIKYEDMLRDSTNTFLNALKFINIEVSDEQLIKAIKNSDFEVLKNMELKNGFEEKPIYMDSFFRKGEVGTWCTNLSSSQVKELENAHHAIMKRFDYLAK